MARLETQIHQIYLLSPDTKNNNLILHEEVLSPTAHLFILLEINSAGSKVLPGDIRKISEIITEKFNANKKLTKDTLFESSLAEINQGLADLAHSGRKNWLGRFSGLVALKSSDSLFLANSGSASAYLKRQDQISEILQSEKEGLHPLKTFTNFVSGKIKEGDELVVVSKKIFNYVSPSLFNKLLLDEGLENCCTTVSKILQDSKGENEVFGSFMLKFQREIQQLLPEIESGYPVFAPQPEEMENSQPPLLKKWRLDYLSQFISNLHIPSLPDFSKLIKGSGNISPARKFFLASFSAFLLLFVLNLGVFAVKQVRENKHENLENQIQSLMLKLNEVDSALIYNNEDEAFEKLAEAITQFKQLKKINKAAALEAEPLVNNAINKVNRISIVKNPKIYAELKHSPSFLAKAGSGFIFANNDPKTVSILNNSLRNPIFLNSIEQGIRGVAHAQSYGNIAVSKSTIYRINESQNQFDLLKNIANADFLSFKFLSPNRAYTIDKSKNQVSRFTFTTAGISDPQYLLKNPPSLSEARDLGVDNDVYVLFPNKVAKFSSGTERVFDVRLSDPLTDANRIFVASNVYILESSKKRMVIVNKNGVVLNQIMFPTINSIKDLYIY